MNEWMVWLDDVGRAGAGWLLWMNGWTFAILVASVILDRVLARHVAARWRMLLFLAVFARLALPVSWESPLAWRSTTVAIAAPSSAHPAPAAVADSSSGHGRSEAASIGPEPLRETVASSEAAAVVTPYAPVGPSWSWFALAPLAYGAGVMVLLGCWLRARLEMRRVLGAAPLAPEHVQREAGGLPVFVHDVIGPAVVGALRPRIVLPSHMMKEECVSMRSFVIEHEHAHVARGDHWLAPMLQWAVMLFWPVAPLWFAASRLRRLMEIACDEHALREADAATRRQYAQELVALAAAQQTRFSAAIPSLGLAGDFAARLQAIANPARPRKARTAQFALVALTSGVLLACSTTGAARLGDLPADEAVVALHIDVAADDDARIDDSQPARADEAVEPEIVDLPAEGIVLDDRWLITVTAWDTHEPFTDEFQFQLVCFNKDPFWPMEAALPFQISWAVWDGVAPEFARVHEEELKAGPFGARLRAWLDQNGKRRMLDKPGTKAVLRNARASWDFPHIANGGADVEKSVLAIRLGRDAEEYVEFTYQMHGRPAREQFPRWRMLLRPAADGSAALLAMPLQDGGRRIILVERRPYVHDPNAPRQTFEAPEPVR